MAAHKRPLYRSLYFQVIVAIETDDEAEEPEKVLDAIEVHMPAKAA